MQDQPYSDLLFFSFFLPPNPLAVLLSFPLSLMGEMRHPIQNLRFQPPLRMGWGGLASLLDGDLDSFPECPHVSAGLLFPGLCLS